MDILDITKNGELKRADNNLLFIFEDQKKIKIPIKKINVINIYSHINLNTELLYFLNSNNIAVNFFQSFTGNYYGSFHVKDIKNSSKVSLFQIREYDNNRFFYQEKFIGAIKENILYVLRKYQKNINFGSKITKIIQDINAVNISKNDPMISEAEIWRLFYSSLDLIISKKDFPFDKRTRRPPENHLNALISFINMKLYGLVLNTMYKTQLDVRIGFVHELQGNRHSLALDIADFIKPIYSLLFVIDIINSGKIKRTDFKFRQYELNEEGLFKLNMEYSKFLNQTIFIDNLKRNVSYKTLIKLECYKLIRKFFNIESEYEPIKFKDLNI